MGGDIARIVVALGTLPISQIGDHLAHVTISIQGGNVIGGR